MSDTTYSATARTGEGLSSDLSYQGTGASSGIAHSRGNILETQGDIEKYLQSAPNLADDPNSQKAYEIAMGVNSPSDKVTIYRSTPSDQINNNDWVFLTYENARNWSVSAFSTDKQGDYDSGKRRVGTNGKLTQVVSIEVPASQVGWSGKNLEFVYTGKNKRGKTY